MEKQTNYWLPRHGFPDFQLLPRKVVRRRPFWPRYLQVEFFAEDDVVLDLVRRVGEAEPLELKHKRIWGLATRRRGFGGGTARNWWGGVRWRQWVDRKAYIVSSAKAKRNAFRYTKYVYTYTARPIRNTAYIKKWRSISMHTGCGTVVAFGRLHTEKFVNTSFHHSALQLHMYQSLGPFHHHTKSARPWVRSFFCFAPVSVPF